MDLILDAGNTTLGWALFDHDRLNPREEKRTHQSFVNHVPEPVVRGHSRWDTLDLNALLGELDEAGAGNPDSITVSSVRPSIKETLFQLVDSLACAERTFLDFEKLTPVIQYAYPAPDTVGIDRWANWAALAAWSPLPAAAVDLGSATTVTLVDGDGRFTGGWIAPGLDARIQGLKTKAPHLPLPPAQLPPPDDVPLIGTNSAEAVAAGVFLGYVGEVMYYLDRLQSQNPGLRNIVLTGGSAQAVYSYFGRSGTMTAPDSVTVHSGLTQAGIALLGRMVRSGK